MSWSHPVDYYKQLVAMTVLTGSSETSIVPAMTHTMFSDIMK